MLSSPQFIESWPIERLVFYVRNPRKNDAAVDRMVASIREFGFKIPVLPRSDGEVVDGHLRLKAARKLGITPHDDHGRFIGIARPSHVIEVKSASRQGSHSAPFPRPLIEFFGKAFSDAGDIIADPFLGSGSAIAAAEALSRAGYGIEISPAYGDVIRRRISNLCGGEPVLAPSVESMADVAAKRGVAIEQVRNPGVRDARRIPQQRPAPFYRSRRKAAQR